MFEQARQELSTLRDLLRFSVSRFNEAGLFFGHGSDNAWDEAAYLLLHALHLPPERLEPFLDARLTSDERRAALRIIERRINERLPAAYLTNEAWLGEHRFYVDQRVIVPRSFIAELLREQLAPWIDDPWAVSRVLDLCTGSGALAIALALGSPGSRVVAVDDDPAALAYARRNAATTAVRIVAGDVTDPDLLPDLVGTVDLVVANPPYIPAGVELQPEVAQHDPAHALFGGPDGMAVIGPIVRRAADWLRAGGLLAVEHDDTTSDATVETIRCTGAFVEVAAHRDLTGRPRFVTARAGREMR